MVPAKQESQREYVCRVSYPQHTQRTALIYWLIPDWSQYLREQRIFEENIEGKQGG